MTIQMLYKVVLIIESVDKILKCVHFQKKATERYFYVVLLNMLYNCGSNY